MQDFWDTQTDRGSYRGGAQLKMSSACLHQLTGEDRLKSCAEWKPDLKNTWLLPFNSSSDWLHFVCLGPVFTKKKWGKRSFLVIKHAWTTSFNNLVLATTFVFIIVSKQQNIKFLDLRFCQTQPQFNSINWGRVREGLKKIVLHHFLKTSLRSTQENQI